MIALLLAHIPFLALLAAIIIVLVRLAAQKERLLGFDEAIRWMLLLPIGVAGIWGAVVHLFFADLAAAFIGWQPSPFQFEVGVANLGMGVVGIVGFLRKNDFGYWFAATLLTSCFLWGAAIGHLYQLIHAHNWAPGNAGLIFYTDWTIPLLLWILLIGWIRTKRHLTSHLH